MTGGTQGTARLVRNESDIILNSDFNANRLVTIGFIYWSIYRTDIMVNEQLWYSVFCKLYQNLKFYMYKSVSRISWRENVVFQKGTQSNNIVTCTTLNKYSINLTS